MLDLIVFDKRDQKDFERNVRRWGGQITDLTREFSPVRSYEALHGCYMEEMVWSEPFNLTYVIVKDDKVVSHVSVQERKVNYIDDVVSAAGVSCVITHKDYRKRGYASRLLEKSREDMKQLFDVGLLFSHRPDFFSKNGYVSLPEEYVIFEPQKADKIESEVSTYKDEFSEHVTQLYEDSTKGIPITLVRPRWYWQRLLDKVIDKQKLLLFLNDGQPLGYLIYYPRENEGLIEFREACARDEKTYADIFSQLCRLPGEYGLERIGGFTTPLHPFYKQLQRGRNFRKLTSIDGENIMCLSLKKEIHLTKPVLYSRPIDHF